VRRALVVATSALAATLLVVPATAHAVSPYVHESGGPNDPRTLNNPQGLVVDAARNVYTADTNNNRLMKWSSGGVFVIASDPNVANRPTGMTLDSGAAKLYAPTA